MNHPDLLAGIEEKTEELKGRGRVLIRSSGTEPLIRVMVECTDAAIMNETVNELVALVKDMMGRAT